MTRLSGPSIVFLDDRSNNDEITASAYASVVLFGDEAVVERIRKNVPTGRGWYQTHAVVCRNIEAYGADLAAEQTAVIQKSLFAFGAIKMKANTTWLARFLAETAHQDATRGGNYLEPLPVGRHDRLMRAHRRLQSQLNSRKSIRRIVRRDNEAIPHARDLATIMRRLQRPASILEVAVISAMLKEKDDEIVALKEEEDQRLLGLFDSGERIDRKSIPKTARNNLNRSIRLASSIVGYDQVRRFAGGEPVVILGSIFQWKLVRTSRVEGHGHGCVEITLCDHEGTMLSRLCSFFVDAPVFDQLAAFALHIQTGNELDLIEVGNLYDLSHIGSSHPALVNRKRLQPDLVLCRSDDGSMVVVHERSLGICADKLYAEAKRKDFVDIVEHSIWGRDVFAIRRLINNSDILKLVEKVCLLS